MFMTLVLYTTNRSSQILQRLLPERRRPRHLHHSFLDPDDTGPDGYGGRGIAPNTIVTPGQWVHVEFYIDFSRRIMFNVQAFDIGSGSKVLISSSTARISSRTAPTTSPSWESGMTRLCPARPSTSTTFRLSRFRNHSDHRRCDQ